jgi:hypothetical protein
MRHWCIAMLAALSLARMSPAQWPRDSAGVRMAVARLLQSELLQQDSVYRKLGWPVRRRADSVQVSTDSGDVVRRFVACRDSNRPATCRLKNEQSIALATVTMRTPDTVQVQVRWVQSSGAYGGCFRSPFVPPNIVVTNKADEDLTMAYLDGTWRAIHDVVTTC